MFMSKCILFKVYGVAECRWYLVSVFYKIQATTYILHIGIDKCRKELL